MEYKDVYGVTFEQGRNELKIDEAMLSNVVTDNKELPDFAVRDQVLSMGPKRLVLTLAIRVLSCTSFSYVLLRLKRVSWDP